MPGRESQDGEQKHDSSRLLDLPAELRNRIYEALFSGPSDRTIDEQIHPRRRPREEDVLALAIVNKQLRRESLPFYWSCTTFRIVHRGHREDSGFDENFYRWLQHVAQDDVKFIRHLELKVRIPYVLPKTGPQDPSSAIITIDLNETTSDEAMSTQGYYSTCPLLIIPWIRKAVANVPRVDRKPIVSKEVLWDIYEACYFLTRSDPREKRTWADFSRAYELNQSKPKPKPWSENVFYEMSQEAIYGPEWRDREAKNANPVKIAWECR